ncbi:DUF2007 domain-containing protein [Aestuariivirga litoralis]
MRNANLGAMEELLRSNDPVWLSYVRHVLDEEGIAFLQLDEHMAALEGSVGAIPRRILVLAEDLARARHSLGNAALTRK